MWHFLTRKQFGVSFTKPPTTNYSYRNLVTWTQVVLVYLQTKQLQFNWSILKRVEFLSTTLNKHRLSFEPRTIAPNRDVVIALNRKTNWATYIWLFSRCGSIFLNGDYVSQELQLNDDRSVCNQLTCLSVFSFGKRPVLAQLKIITTKRTDRVFLFGPEPNGWQLHAPVHAHMHTTCLYVRASVCVKK